MSDPNPYQAPAAAAPAAVGVLSGKLSDVRNVAKYQKGINACILGYLLLTAAMWGSVMLPPSRARAFVALGIALCATVVIVLGFVYSVVLATKVYGIVIGVLAGLLVLIPLLGLLILFLINQRATGILKENGFRVGFLGADLSEIDARIAASNGP